ADVELERVVFAAEHRSACDGVHQRVDGEGLTADVAGFGSEAGLDRGPVRGAGVGVGQGPQMLAVGDQIRVEILLLQGRQTGEVFRLGCGQLVSDQIGACDGDVRLSGNASQGWVTHADETVFRGFAGSNMSQGPEGLAGRGLVRGGGVEAGVVLRWVAEDGNPAEQGVGSGLAGGDDGARGFPGGPLPLADAAFDRGQTYRGVAFAQSAIDPEL